MTSPDFIGSNSHTVWYCLLVYLIMKMKRRIRSSSKEIWDNEKSIMDLEEQLYGGPLKPSISEKIDRIKHHSIIILKQ